MTSGPRVAMFVFGTAHNDSRVQRELAALGAAGFDVRVFALASDDHPPGVVRTDGGEIERVAAAPLLARLRKRYGNRSLPTATATAPPRLRRPLHRRIWQYGRRLALRAARAMLRPLHRATYERNFRERAATAALSWKPHVVHAHDLNTLGAAVAVGRAGGASIVYDSHELWRHRNRSGAAWIGKTHDWWTERRLIRHADLVITVADGIADWLAEKYRIQRPLVVRNTPDTAPASAPVPGLHDLADLPDDASIVAYTGRITTLRGVEAAVDALTHLPESTHLVMLGYGNPEYMSKIFAQAEVAGVSARVHRVGPVSADRVSATLRDALVAVVMIEPVFLSYAMSLPNKLFEAIHARVPVVTSPDLVEVSAIVEKYGIGELANHSGPAVAGAVSRIATRRDSYLPGLDEAAATFTWDREAERLESAYRDLIRTSSGSA